MNENYNKELKPKLMKLIKNIPDSNGSRYFKKIDKNIAIITDEFMYDYYKDCVNLIYINYFNYKETIENNKIDLFLYITTWKGLENYDWRGGKPNGKLQLETVEKVIDLCKLKGIPTVFQSKEDPTNYNVFISIAKKCDYIFTTDINKIDDYKKECNNENVYLSTFGINPLIHNPIGIKSCEKLDEVLFAGSYMKRYPHRGEDMEKIFSGVLDSGRNLDIIDRNFFLNNSQYFYPQKYIPYTSPPVSHKDLQKIHKLYNWIINLNSVKYSPTMCAVRCYEAQALGNCILSNYSMAINDSSPNIFLVYDKSQVKSILNGFAEDEIYKHQMWGVRNVMNDRCVFDKISYILNIVDDDYSLKNTKKGVLVVADKINRNITEMFNSQIYDHKYLVEENKAKEIYDHYDFITFFRDDYFYGQYYLQDMINGFKYTDSDYITKDSYYNGKSIIKGIEHDYVNIMKDKYKTIFDVKAFTFEFLNFLRKEVNLKNGYSIDHFELNTNDYREKYKISVIVQVYNNGNHLLNKCFNSLKISTMFDDMEIILIDKGSDDKDTLAILNRLNREYKNVKLNKLDKEKNKVQLKNIDINLLNGEFITFLQANNETINDGYVKLYKIINNSNYDIATGKVLKVGEEEVLIENNILSKDMEGLLIRKDVNLNKLDEIDKEKIMFLDEITNIYYEK
nr:glycosyltransferase [uncultured Terrisporobacter sp.]